MSNETTGEDTLVEELQLLVRRSICGNGQREAGEACDDNNLIDGDGCSASCEDEA